jgi:hypothetical protein
MVESDEEALVKEERCLEAIPVVLPLQTSAGGGPQTLYFVVFYLCLYPS